MCAVRRGIDERDYRDLTGIGSLEPKGRRRSSLSAMMELRHLELVACLVRRFRRVVGKTAQTRITSPSHR
jgi:hypothetical protein